VGQQYFGRLSLSVRQEFDEMRITYFLPNRCWAIQDCYLSWP